MNVGRWFVYLFPNPREWCWPRIISSPWYRVFHFGPFTIGRERAGLDEIPF